MNVSLRQLKGFLLVASTGSFTRAAERLHITQAGLSAMMRDLEAQFDCRLFDRTTRSVVLTKEGYTLLSPAETAIAQLESAQAAVKLSTSQARHILTIAATPVFASLYAPEICRKFALANPAVDVRIRDVPRGEIQAVVARGEADVGFGIFLKETSGIALQSLFNFQILYIAPAGSLWKGRRELKAGGLRSLAWSRIPELPLISLSPEIPVQQVIDRRLQDAGLQRTPRQTCNNMQTVVAMVAAGFGAAILPSMLLPSCPSDRFDIARLVSPVAQVSFYRMTRKGHVLAPVAAPFIETTAEVVQLLCSSQPVHL